METVTGYTYTVEGFEDVTEFAKSILLLINLKSNDQGIMEVKTFAGTNLINVVTDHENDTFIESNVGKVINKDELNICVMTYDDLSRAGKQVVEMIDDCEDEYFMKVDIL